MSNPAVKRTPDRKVAQGVTVGGILGVVTALIMALSHKSLTPNELAFIPMAVGVIGHFVGSYLAPYVPRINDIIAYVKALLAEVPPANLPE